MNIKKETIRRYISQVELLLANNCYTSALNIAANYPLKNNYTICQTRALKEFKVKKDELLKVNHVVKENPHYRQAGAMNIFLIVELESLFERRVHRKRRITSEVSKTSSPKLI